MVDYATLEDFRRFTAEMLSEERSSTVRKAEARSSTGSTFLSHSSKDRDYLPGVVHLLENHGATVYVDKKDETLPPYTSRETAKVLRSRVAQCKKFVLLATEASKDSRWMPWELGLADGIKTTKNAAIFPGVDNLTETKWAEREYLGIYDRIVWGALKGESKNKWLVWNQEKNTATALSVWLRE